VIGLTKSPGKELARTEIRVNCVTPAAVRTPIFRQMTESHIDFMLSKIPIGRFGEIPEVTCLVCWLASEECSFSTGAVLMSRAAALLTEDRSTSPDESALIAKETAASQRPVAVFRPISL
jgi:NAD(P)-dependent dehydrogenase (short-subunit alcohol dehydrogenase family)